MKLKNRKLSSKEMSKTKAAAMADATKGRARVFESKKKDDSKSMIREGLEEYEEKRKKDVDKMD